MNVSIKKNLIDVINKLINNNPNLLNSKDSNGSTPLHHAANDEGCDDAVKALLDHSDIVIDPIYTKTPRNKRHTPFSLALANSRYETIRLLLNKSKFCNNGKQYTMNLEDIELSFIALLLNEKDAINVSCEELFIHKTAVNTSNITALLETTIEFSTTTALQKLILHFGMPHITSSLSESDASFLKTFCQAHNISTNSVDENLQPNAPLSEESPASQDSNISTNSGNNIPPQPNASLSEESPASQDSNISTNSGNNIRPQPNAPLSEESPAPQDSNINTNSVDENLQPNASLNDDLPLFKIFNFFQQHPKKTIGTVIFLSIISYCLYSHCCKSNFSKALA